MSQRKKIYKELRRIAGELPATKYVANIRMSGKELLDQDEEAETMDGENIIADHRYKVQRQYEVNHYNRMKTIWTVTVGDSDVKIAAVKAYMDGVFGLFDDSVQGGKEMRKGLNERVNALKF